MNITKKPKSEITTFSELLLGEVFCFASDMKCVGLKISHNRYLHLQNIDGASTFNVFDGEANEKVTRQGKLIGVEVE